MPRRAKIAIHLLLALQILLPLHFYACDGDKRDERFAWRMFSSTRVEKCSAQFFLGDSPRAIRTANEFHNAWVGIALRGRQSVLEGMARALCEENPGTAVRVRVLCEKEPGLSARNRGLLSDAALTRSSEKVELVADGIFNFCERGTL